jgi:hypothetical protein
LPPSWGDEEHFRVASVQRHSVGARVGGGREKIDRSYLCRVLRLTLLGPEVVEAIMNGRHPAEVTLPALMKGFPVEWAPLERKDAM